MAAGRYFAEGSTKHIYLTYVVSPAVAYIAVFLWPTGRPPTVSPMGFAHFRLASLALEANDYFYLVPYFVYYMA